MSDIYWDEVNGKVTNDPNHALIYDNAEWYSETYELQDGSFFKIEYTQEFKIHVNMYYFRKDQLELHKLQYSDLKRLVRLGVPHDIYEQEKKKMEVD